MPSEMKSTSYMIPFTLNSRKYKPLYSDQKPRDGGGGNEPQKGKITKRQILGCLDGSVG